MKRRAVRPDVGVGILQRTTGGIEPPFVAKKAIRGMRFVTIVECDVCGKKGERLSGHCAPKGWLYGESFVDDKKEVIVVYACGLECCASFWKPGPGDLYSGKMPRVSDVGQLRADGVDRKTVRPKPQQHYIDTDLGPIGRALTAPIKPWAQISCPRCGSTEIIDASQSYDCNGCGHSW